MLQFHSIGKRVYPLPNPIKNIYATDKGTGIFISWDNTGLYLDKIVIVRKENQLPSNVNDGTKVYEGLNSSFLDTNVSKNVKYYYRAFSYNKKNIIVNGNYVDIIYDPIQPVSIFGDFDFSQNTKDNLNRWIFGEYWYDGSTSPAKNGIRTVVLTTQDVSGTWEGGMLHIGNNTGVGCRWLKPDTGQLPIISKGMSQKLCLLVDTNDLG